MILQDGTKGVENVGLFTVSKLKQTTVNNNKNKGELALQNKYKNVNKNINYYKHRKYDKTCS